MDFILHMFSQAWATSPWAALALCIVIYWLVIFASPFVVIYLVASIWLPTWLAVVIAVASFLLLADMISSLLDSIFSSNKVEIVHVHHHEKE